MNLIANAFAFREDYGNSTQLKDRSDEQKYAIYMKNIVVSLVSAKMQNPEDEVMLIATSQPPEKYASILKEKGIKISVIPFDSYVMPQRFHWALAFFKLCTLEWMAQQEYENILLMDADTVTVQPFTQLWKEAAFGMMFYNVGHSFDHPERAVIREDYERLWPEGKDLIVHYGGEFICGNKEALGSFLQECRDVFAHMEKMDFPVAERTGDESVIAYAAARYKKKALLIEAGAYIWRYWTEKKFYLAATNTQANPVCIWHLPGEKDKGLLILYSCLEKKGRLPEKEKMMRVLGLVQAKRPYPLHSLYAQLIRRQAGKR